MCNFSVGSSRCACGRYCLLPRCGINQVASRRRGGRVSYKIISAARSCIRWGREALFSINPLTCVLLLWSGRSVPLCVPSPLPAEKAEAEGPFVLACESLRGGSQTLCLVAIASGHGGSLQGIICISVLLPVRLVSGAAPARGKRGQADGVCVAGDVAAGPGVCQRVRLSPDLTLQPCAAPCALILTRGIVPGLRRCDGEPVKCFEILA